MHARCDKCGRVSTSQQPLWFTDGPGLFTVCQDCLRALQVWFVEKQAQSEHECPTLALRKLTRHEQLQGLADRGIDTWEDYRGEK